MDAPYTHRDLVAWKEAMRLVEVIYRETSGFPREEQFGLTAQLRRAAVSIPSNLAEGAARNSSAELAHFLGITCGSVAELETQLELAHRLGFLKENAEALRGLTRVGKPVRNLRKSVHSRRI